MPVDQDELNRALSRGRLEELPPSRPPGLLGDTPMDIRKTDEFEPSLNAGVLQESTWQTRGMTLALLYVLVVTSPIAAWMLWRDKKLSLTRKIVATVIGIVGYVALYLGYRH
jgi:hypothetical protein